jgi:hypothetical protein
MFCTSAGIKISSRRINIKVIILEAAEAKKE